MLYVTDVVNILGLTIDLCAYSLPVYTDPFLCQDLCLASTLKFDQNGSYDLALKSTWWPDRDTPDKPKQDKTYSAVKGPFLRVDRFYLENA